MEITEERAPLSERCVETALEIIADRGLDKLSLREVARRLGVSHQAPYKHFPSRDHLLAVIVERCFGRFNAAMAAARTLEDPREVLREKGRAYLRFATEHPLEYRLMFGDPIPSDGEHPEMLSESQCAFQSLLDAVAAVKGVPADEPSVLSDAYFVWSTVHGFATLCQTAAMEKHGPNDPATRQALAEAVLDRIGDALKPRHLA